MGIGRLSTLRKAINASLILKLKFKIFREIIQLAEAKQTMCVCVYIYIYIYIYPQTYKPREVP